MVVGISVAGAGPAKHRAPTISDQRQKEFAAAGAEFGVPADLLLAVSYALTGWSATASGGIGPMHLTDADPAAWAAEQAGRGRAAGPASAPPAVATAPELHTLTAAATLIGVPAAKLRTDPAQNIRGGAALLARYAKEATGGALPASTIGWYGALARYGTGDAMAGRTFADDVLALVRAGVPGTVVAGQSLKVAGQPKLTTAATTRIPDGFGASDAVECPTGLTCRFVPAAYAANGVGPAGRSTDPTAYGNYDPANRPADGNQVRYLVVGDTGGTYDAAIAAAQQPTSGRSAHYLVRSTDGQVTQMVRTEDIAWHAGNWTMNTASIGIQVESKPGDGARGYSDAAYRSAAKLVRWLAAEYKIPLDRQHILGLDEVPGAGSDGQSTRHGNLGNGWAWPTFMSLLGAPLRAEAWRADRVVTIARRGGAVALHTDPSADAPLITAAGRPATDDWTGKVAAGQSYAVAERRGDWIAIWFGGRKAWFADPGGKLTLPGDGVLVTAVDGVTRVPVYTEVTPESGAYPAGVPASEPTLLARASLPAGQAYRVTESVDGQDYFARFDGASVPGNHTVVIGGNQYVMITYDHRQAYVAASDVVLTGLE
jgi:hypothetical protein